jgi:DnaJ like chaperone protein
MIGILATPRKRRPRRWRPAGESAIITAPPLTESKSPVMEVLGKIVGGAAGFAIGGPLGALVGAVAGHAVDHIRTLRTIEDPDLTRQGAFTIAVIALGAKMAKADGSVSPIELDAVKEVFRVPPSQMRNFERVFDVARRDAAAFEPYARQVARMFADQPGVLEELLDALFHIAKADRVAHPDEVAYLRRVAAIFGFDDQTFERLRAAHFGRDGMDPYAVLGVARDAPDGEIREAWRRLIRENHPDSLVAQGVPKEFVALATDRVATINVAYDTIRRQRAGK